MNICNITGNESRKYDNSTKFIFQINGCVEYNVKHKSEIRTTCIPYIIILMQKDRLEDKVNLTYAPISPHIVLLCSILYTLVVNT